MEKQTGTSDTKKLWSTSTPIYGWISLIATVLTLAALVIFIFYKRAQNTEQPQGAPQELIELLGQQDEIINKRNEQIEAQNTIIGQLEKSVDSLKKENGTLRAMTEATKRTYAQSLTNYRKKPKSVPIADAALGDTIAKLKAKYGLR